MSPSTGTRRVWAIGALYLAITIVFAYPFSFHMMSRLFSADSDSLLVQWIVAWDVHAFTHQPWHIFDANIFAPVKNTLAFAENLIGSAMLAAPVLWITGSLVLALNVVSLISIPLSGLGTYLLARRLRISEAGAILAGLIFAFDPPRFLRIEQFQLTTIQWMPFCLAYVHAYLDEGRRRDLRIALAFFSLQALTGGHGAAFLTAAVLLLLAYRFSLGEPLAIPTRLRDMGWPGALLLAPTILVYLPYQGARVEQGLARTLDGWGTTPSSFLASPSHVDMAILQQFPAWLREAPDAYLFPGWIPLLIVATGLLWTAISWTVGAGARPRWWQRAAWILEAATVAYTVIGLWALISGNPRLKLGGLTVMTVRHLWRIWATAAICAGLRAALHRRVPFAPLTQLGPTLRRCGAALRRQRTNSALFYAIVALLCAWLMIGPPYGVWQWVYKWPVLNFIRAPTRFVLLGLMSFAVLAGMAFDRMCRPLSRVPRVVMASAMAVLCLIEFASMPLEGRPYELIVPAADQWLNQQPKPFVVGEVPMPDPDDVNLANTLNARYMLHATAHWQQTVHGYSGLLPKAHEDLYAALWKFPSQDAITRLLSFNVTYVVVHEDFSSAAQRAKTDAALLPFAAWLTLVHEAADGRVYALHRPTS